MRKLPFLLIFCACKTFAQPQQVKLKITPLVGDFFVYTTYNYYQGARIPANGMYLLTDKGAVLFDTPWDTTQFQPLLDSIKIKHGKEVITCIATHWHSDKTEGLEYYRSLGIETFTTLMTDELSKKNKKKRAEHLMAGDTVFTIGKYVFETFYPGEGHTSDNIVLWFGNEKILYAGCLVKGVDDKTLGNLSDANVMEYENTLRRLKLKYPNPNVIIISHSDWNNLSSLDHSIEMASELRKKNTQQ